MNIAVSRPKVLTASSAFLAALLVLGASSACATLARTPAAISGPASTAIHTPTDRPAETPASAATTLTPTEEVVRPTLSAATMEPTETPEMPTRPAATMAPTVTPPPAAQYRLTFEATWSRETHPADFPPNPHFSGLIGATHSPTVHLWEEGEAASAGIQSMAETGRKSPLDSEIGLLIGNGSACAQISGGGVNPSPGTATVTFTARRECPLVSVVTMIAPSPDWFVGVADLNLLATGEWIEERVVELLPYDAGTDSGSSYTSPDDPTGSPETIYRIGTTPFLVDGTMPPLGTFTFTRLDD